MMFRIYMLAAMALCSVQAHAATWYVFLGPYPTDLLMFFDSDTVSKQSDRVTIWEKNINKPGHPDSDGSYATASKTAYSCSKRTSQTFTSSVYDSDGVFMRTYSNPSKEADIVPDTVGEITLKIVCASDFPRNHSGKDYIRIADNDIFGFAKRYFNAIEAARNDPAPK